MREAGHIRAAAPRGRFTGATLADVRRRAEKRNADD
jgi:hypothetical protein